ncbi:MAG: hypothetical protein DLM59_01805 [Pseudonocardiales bacterium]|nr:MAG: hypothetical protein DLM59_01805 [Pseudonocardiales bacterium]
MLKPPTSSRAAPGRISAVLVATAVAGLALSACSNSSNTSGAHHGAMPAQSMSAHDGMSGTGMGMAAGDGLAATTDGLTLLPAASTLPAGVPAPLGFRITGTDGHPVTTFEPDQTKLMHLYLIRSDLTGFQHIHPTMAADGTWTAPLAPARPGTYRAYTAFTAKTAGKTVSAVLSRPLTVPGTATDTPLPPPATTTQADGYTLTVHGGQMMAGMAHTLTVTVTRNGRPVTDLQPYLDSYAHLTAIHAGDLAFAHLHPHGTVNGNHGGPALTFTATLPRAGDWRLFIQFQTHGALHTAAVTLHVG